MRTERVARAVCFAVIACLATMGFVRFGAAGHDDTFIMLWSGETFTLARGFVNFNMEQVEIGSSWLGAWAGTLSHWLTPNTALFTYKALAALAGLGCVIVVWWQRDVLLPGPPGRRAWGAVFVIAVTLLSPTFVYWIHGGLETAYQCLLFALWLALAHRQRVRGSVRDAVALACVSALVVLVRTEGFWIALALAWVLLLTRHHRVPTRRDAAVIASVSLFVAATFVVRYAYTHAVWPNPVYAKVDSFENNLRRGANFLAGYYQSGPLATVHVVALGYAAALSAWALRNALRREARGDATANAPTPLLIAAATLCLGQEAFALLSGGNWMEYYRFLSPTVLPKGLLLVHLFDTIRPRVAPSLQALLIGAVGAAAVGQYALDDGANGPWRRGCRSLRLSSLGTPWLVSLEKELLAANTEHGRDVEWLTPFVDTRLATLVRETGGIRAVSYQAGFFPYVVRRRFSVDEVLVIDTHGLNDRDVATASGARDFFGLDDGGGLERVIAGVAGDLSRIVLRKRPNLAYGVDASPTMRAVMNAAGYELVWDTPGAKVFLKRR